MIKNLNFSGWRLLPLLLALTSALGFAACGGGGDSDGDGKSGQLRVVATTGMVGDMVAAIGGEGIDLTVMMGPGVDPHSFNPGIKDTLALEKADLIFYSGLMLEGKMENDWASHAKKSHAVASAVPGNRLKGDAAHPDPHVWGDVDLWSSGIDGVVAAFVKINPDDQAGYKERGAAYAKELGALHQWATDRAQLVPEDKRVLVTSHDAFSYFGDAYGFKVYGLQGISTAASFGAADRAALVKIIEDLGVATIFVESSVKQGPIKSVAQDAGVAVADTELFSDAMGTPGDMETVDGESYDLGTYAGMIKHNMNALVGALK